MSEALPMPNDGCSCTPHVQDAGGGHFEHLLEYEPACPEHSEHLWSPRQGMWVDRAAHDAAVAAKAWREGFTTGQSRAMRHMSDEPLLPLSAPNPYEREGDQR